MEDLKSAEQLVKKKQQLENQQRTSELQQLVASQHSTTTSSYRVPSTSGKLFYLTLGIFNNETLYFYQNHVFILNVFQLTWYFSNDNIRELA